MPGQPVLDGQSILPLFDGKMTEREKPLGFMLWNGKGNFGQADLATEAQAVWIDGKHKLIVPPSKPATAEEGGKGGKRAEKKAAETGVALYDIYADPAHKN